MGVIFVSIAALFTAYENFLFRRSSDNKGSTKGYLSLAFFSAFFLMIFLNPIRTGNYSFNLSICLLGFFAGAVLSFTLLSLGLALKKGPSGLSFAAMNSSSIIPAIIMAALFGAALGHSYTFYHGIGSLLVLLGLFWAGKNTSDLNNARQWMYFISLAFVLHVVFLLIMQWRVLLISSSELSPYYRLMSMTEAKSEWFMPMIYLGAFLFQIILFTVFEKRTFTQTEITYGLSGGLFNGSSTFFLIQATEYCTSIESYMIFPIFSVLIIIFCNLWGSYLYKEKINWKASQICMAGLIIGTVDWEHLLKKLGY